VLFAAVKEFCKSI